ncbi:MAG TPA: hypothetical protein VNK52_01055 [Hyphomicrobiaceae bacterium]|nr:hypothetical protein [Hyphomicrobiaceae bacterium]
MANMFDLTDVPMVAPEDLAIPMRQLIRGERAALAVLYGTGEADVRLIEAAFWQEFNGNTAAGVAVLLRFRGLISLFAVRRLRDRLLEKGHALIGPAVAVAAGMRLNAKWGFNPNTFLWALAALEARDAGEPAAARLEHGEQRLAA